MLSAAAAVQRRSGRRLYVVGPAFGQLLLFVAVPATLLAVFANELVPEGRPPREWVERMYAVRRWTEMPRGGHFAALEEPELLLADVRSFFREVRSA